MVIVRIVTEEEVAAEVIPKNTIEIRKVTESARITMKRNRVLTEINQTEKKSLAVHQNRVDRKSPRKNQKNPRKKSRKSSKTSSDKSPTKSKKSSKSSKSSKKSPKKDKTSSNGAKSSAKHSDGSKAPVGVKSEKKQRGEKRKLTVAETDLQSFAKKVRMESVKREVPKFLSKKQRQELALKRLAEKRAAQKEQLDTVRDTRKEFESNVRNSKYGSSRDRRRDYGGSRMSERERDRERKEREASRSVREVERKKREEDGRTEKSLQLIKDMYLGKKQKKKKIIPPSQKFKFSFDWEATDDTTETINPLYSKRHQVSFQFGRGYVAGIDREAQKKDSTVYQEMASKHTITDPDLKAAIDRKREERKEKERVKEKEMKKVMRHWKEKRLDEMTSRDWRIFKEDYNISTRGSNLPLPIRYWKESGLPKDILETLKKVGYKEPTPIQRMGIPIGLTFRDVVGIAETGSGKTAAFLLPMLVYISKLPPMTRVNAADGPYALILAPTRELVQQIEQECHKFAEPIGIRAMSIVGGVHIERQGMMMRDGSEILIA
eukprot:87453_1